MGSSIWNNRPPGACWGRSGTNPRTGVRMEARTSSARALLGWFQSRAASSPCGSSTRTVSMCPRQAVRGQVAQFVVGQPAGSGWREPPTGRNRRPAGPGPARRPARALSVGTFRKVNAPPVATGSRALWPCGEPVGRAGQAAPPMSTESTPERAARSPRSSAARPVHPAPGCDAALRPNRQI